MAGDSVDIPFPGNFLGIANRAVKDLSDQDCDDMASFYYDRYLWTTDDRDDLYRAAIYRWMKRKRTNHILFIKLKTVDEVMAIWKEGVAGNDIKTTLDELADKEFKKTF